MIEESDSATTESTDTNRPLNKNSGRNGSITDNLGKTTFLQQQTHFKINATEDSPSWPLKDVESLHRKDNRTSWAISEKRYPHIRHLPDVVPPYTNNTNEYSIEKSSFQAIFYDPPPPYRLEKEQSELPEDGRLLTEIKQKHEETHEAVQRVRAVVDNMAKMQEESKRREEENNRNITRMQEAQSSMEKTIDDLKTMLQKREEHDEALQQGQSIDIQRRKMTSKGEQDSACSDEICKKCGCKRTCPCPCHRRIERRIDKLQIDRDLVRKDGELFGARPKTNERTSFIGLTPTRTGGIKTYTESNTDHESCYDGLSNVVNRESSNEDIKDENLSLFADGSSDTERGLSASGGPPDNPSSGDDDNDDKDYDHERKKSDERRQRKKAKRIWKIDVSAWKNCAELKSEGDLTKEAQRLLKGSKIPNGLLLDTVCKRLGRKHKTTTKICNAICGYIKQQREDIVEVWAGYEYNLNEESDENKVVFVVLTSCSDKIMEEQFPLICRGYQEITSKEENIEIMQRENADQPKEEELQGPKEVLQRLAPELMQKHKKLVRVTVSWMKHTVGKPSAIRKCPCIALYVQVRGVVPLDEEPFRKEIEKFPIDVREGLITLCKGPSDSHKHLKMGCTIRGQGPIGTLGPFIKFEEDNTQFALTSAHVLFQGDSFKFVLEKGPVNYFDNQYYVYQPGISASDEHPFGEVVFAMHKKGSNGIAGMEIAVIKVHTRHPNSGKFPNAPNHAAAGFGPEKPFVFTSGNVMSLSELKTSSTVWKYGSETMLTKGKIRIDAASVRTRAITASNIGIDLQLNGQIEIVPCDNTPFASYGDSGALVVAWSEATRQLEAVGIFEGQAIDGTCFIVTPMEHILSELSSEVGSPCYLNSFHQLQSSHPTFRMYATEQNLASLTSRVTEIDSRFDSRFRALAFNFENHKQEIKNEFASNFENHKQEIKSEFASQKSEISKDLENQRKDICQWLEQQRQDQHKESNELKSHISQLFMSYSQR